MNDDATVAAVLAALEAVGELVLSLRGESMGSVGLRAGKIRVVPVTSRNPRWGDVVLFERHGRMYAHRLIFRWGDRYWTKGDARWACDVPAPKRSDLIAIAVAWVRTDGRSQFLRWRRVAAFYQLLRAVLAMPVWWLRGFAKR